jgi:putative phosphotransacetylase
LLHKPHRPRFVRLSAEHCRAILGLAPESLEPWMLISNGRFVAKQRITMIGPKGRIDGVAVVGPVVGETEVSLAVPDEERLGLSSDPGRGVLLVGPAGEAKVVAPE